MFVRSLLQDFTSSTLSLSHSPKQFTDSKLRQTREEQSLKWFFFYFLNLEAPRLLLLLLQHTYKRNTISMMSKISFC